MDKNIVTIWVYEYSKPADNYTNIELFDTEDSAYSHACARIKNSMIRDYGMDDPDDDHYDIYLEISNLLSNLNYRQAVSDYSDWVSDVGWDEQIYHNVFPAEMRQSGSVPPIKSSSSKSKRAQFVNGATCKCGYHNEYVSESNQDDGTYKCGTCKALGGVFG